MLPPPTLTFTIPSIHDNTVLDCRVYHPVRLNPNTVSHVSAPWEKKAALVSHPYGPLGGSYDDPMVDVVAATILKEGFIVGTFNFRGAGSSKGRTSWSSKPEQGDYISMIGFLSYYLYHLSVPALHTLPPGHSNFAHDASDDQSPPISPTKKRPRSLKTSFSSTVVPTQESDAKRLLLLAGYSYGGIITSSIPALTDATVLPVFSSPQIGTAHAEIRLRARNLATQQNELLHTRFDALLSEPRSPTTRGRSTTKLEYNVGSPSGIPKSTGGVRMGGEEDLRRSSREALRSSSFTIETPERVRKSMDRVRSMARVSRFGMRRENSIGSVASSSRGEAAQSVSSVDTIKTHHITEKSSEELEKLNEVPGIMDNLDVAYLLVSPPHGILGNLATLFTSKSLWAKPREKDLVTEEDMRFITNPTLTIFCPDDAVISARRLRAWSDRLSKVAGSQFRYVEVKGGGHFWHDYDAIRTLRHEIKAFIENLS